MNASITIIAVRNQLAGMGCDRFDIGVLRPNARMLLREGWSPDQINAAINWLQRENARGAHIFVRPDGEHVLTLLDDLNFDAIREMKACGFRPAVVVETSPHNFQVWLNHGRILDCKLSTLAAQELARQFGGDPSSADWHHFGRLAGFTNQKPSRRLESGLPPFVRLREWNGRIYDQAQDFLNQIVILATAACIQRQSRRTSASFVRECSIRPLREFHNHPKYRGDIHRADMAWALYAASHGLSEAKIECAILHARDLSKKGGLARQLGYAERTATKAIATVRPIHP